MKLGGFSPFPAKLGGGTPRVKLVLDTLNADRGTAYDATTRTTYVYAHNMAIARAISAGWGTNERLARLWSPECCSMDVLERWEQMMALYPAPTDDDDTRRTRVDELMARFGQESVDAVILDLLTDKLGSVFVGIEHIDYVYAAIYVPDGTYPWGSVDSSGNRPWSSSIAHVLVRLQAPTGYTEGEFYAAAGQVIQLLEPRLPVWVTIDWYRPGSTSATFGNVSAAGFYLDDVHNVDNEILST